MGADMIKDWWWDGLMVAVVRNGTCGMEFVEQDATFVMHDKWMLSVILLCKHVMMKYQKHGARSFYDIPY